MKTPFTKERPRRSFVPAPPPKTVKSAGTRNLLIDLAARLFVERGYSDVTMRDIALAAELTTGALYGHFRSKGQLLVEVIRWKLAAQDQSTDFVEVASNIESGVNLMHNDAGRDLRLLEVDAAAAARHDSEVASGLATIYQDRHERIRDAMADAKDPDTAAWIIAALTAGFGTKESTGLRSPDSDRLNAALVVLVKGLGRT